MFQVVKDQVWTENNKAWSRIGRVWKLQSVEGQKARLERVLVQLGLGQRHIWAQPEAAIGQVRG